MKILLVDDSKLARHQLYAMLRELGYSSIVACEDVPSARTVLAAGDVDLIFADYNMPGESGLDLVHWVRANAATAKTPIVMVTTVSEREKIIEAVKSGVQNYIFKPVQRRILAEKLSDLARTYGFEPPKVSAPAEPQSPAPPATPQT